MTNGSPDLPQPSQPPNHEAPRKLALSQQQIAERTRGVIENFHSQSGIGILYEPGRGFLVEAPRPAVDMTEDQLIAWAQAEYGVPAKHFQGEHREELLEEARRMKAHEHIGGFGITARDMPEMEELCPPLPEALRTEHGKVVVLGSGFSTLPAELASMHKAGQLNERPVIVDLFDYRQAHTDFLELQRRFTEAGLDFPFAMDLARLTDIVTAIDEGDLEAVRYTVGTGNPPQATMNASLIVNIFGPPDHTLWEQLSMLKPGGKLLSNSDFQGSPLGSDFKVEGILQLDKRGYASSVTKVQSPQIS